MKKIITAVLLMIMGISTVSAQRYGGSVFSERLSSSSSYYGFRFGYNTAMLKFNTEKIGNSSNSGINFGFVAGFPLGESAVIFEPGILYSVKGGKTNDEKNIKTNVTMHTFELPFVLKYDVALPTMADVAIQPFFGGFFDLGMGGKIKAEKGGQREKLKTYSNRFARFDAGLRMGVGMRIDFFYVDLAYDLGLRNLGSDSKAFCNPEAGLYPLYDDFEDSVHSGCFSVNVGINF